MSPISESENKSLSRNCLRESSESSSGSVSENSSNGDSIPGQDKLFKREYTSLLDKINSYLDAGDPFFSLEFFPPRTPNGVANLLKRMERMEEGRPLFVDVTWHPGGNPASDRVTSSTHIAGACLDFCYHETMLHITCAQYNEEQNLVHLERAKQLGIRNILALRGDLPEDPEKRREIENSNNLKYAVDLVHLIRKHYGDYFTIGVAGYPGGHPDADDYGSDMRHLKEKVDAGADIIITQLFFDAEDYFSFERDCREIGIDVPIIPGVMPIQSYDSLRHIVRLSKLTVPDEVRLAVEPIKNNEEAIRNFGIDYATKMCKQLLEIRNVPGLHFYTLNKEIATRNILINLGMWQERVPRIFPWKAHVSHHRRCSEEIRPIFWSSRPKAYIYRTKHWDDFPKGYWNINSSHRYGNLKDYYMFYLKDKTSESTLKDMWGDVIESEQDIWHMFYCFITGDDNKDGHKVKSTPWNGEDSVQAETGFISDRLAWCNANGFLTVNSQPNVNGIPSDDPVSGWGMPGGYIYRKAYLEFFTSKEKAAALLELVSNFPRINYHFINYDGSEEYTNNGNTPISVTWGVQPGADIQQPTVVDPVSFRVWKDEAFGEWNVWQKLYEPETTSFDIIENVKANYVLVNLVDNDYVKDTCIWSLLKEANDMLSNA